ELAIGELTERSPKVDGVAAGFGETTNRLDRSARADDRAVLEDVALGDIERIEARSDQPLERRGQAAGARDRLRARLADEGGELLDEERVPSAALVQQRGELRGRVGAEQLVHERRRRVRAQGIEVEDGEVVASRGRLPTLTELGASGRDQHERAPTQPLEQSLDEPEHELVGPVRVG